MEPLPQFDSAVPARLTPAMASFKALVLGFVTEYIIRHRISPSQGEIIHALGSTRSRVRDALRSLERDRLILRTPGERGLALPSEKDQALRLLERLGWELRDGVLASPGADSPVSSVPFDLDYP